MIAPISIINNKLIQAPSPISFSCFISLVIKQIKYCAPKQKHDDNSRSAAVVV